MKKFRIILLVFNIIAALGLISTTLAGLVAPSTSIIPSVLAYGFMPMLLLNIVLLIVWLIMGRWEALISAGTILVRFSYIGLFFQLGGTSEVPSRAEHPDMVVLLSYNLHNFSGDGLESTPKADNADNFLKLLDEHTPDILCLQEFANVSKRNVTDSLRARGYKHAYGARGGSNSPSGTVVFSKLPITYVKNIDKQKVLVEIRNGSRKFRLCCVHMDSYAFDANERNKIEEMRHGKIDDSTSRRTMGKAKETVLQHEKEWETQLYPVVSGSTLPFLPPPGSTARLPITSTTHTATKAPALAPPLTADSPASESTWSSTARSSPPSATNVSRAISLTTTPSLSPSNSTTNETTRQI